MLNKKSKSIIALLLVALMCFAAVGCGSPASKEPAETSNETAAPASGLRPEGVPKDFPNKEIQWIYAFGPGSPMDAYFRILADKIQKTEGWKHGFVVTYKEGASGRIGWNAFAQAKPDGYTLGFAPSAMLISAVSEDVSYGADKISYIINTMSDPGAIGVATGSQYKSLKDLVEAAKANPGKVTIGVTSTIGQEGLTVKLIEKASGAKFNMVAFDGEAEIFAAVIGKHLDAFCLNISDATTFIEEKQVEILATGDEERSPFLPDVPTYKEAGYDVTQLNMRGIGGPAGIPEPIRQYLENCFIAAANDPEVKAKAAEMKIPVDTLTGTELQSMFTSIADTYKKLYEEDPWN
ncbi:Bug family tripartite tricarboxylate transporter substrate binding protein [Lutispora sp.]|uniref:Bug family tripartite tricarboxylate transporter substrate binding protein n=1 Tax=Lutispora sp. TaxID=2828727 RepID=UPI000ED9D8EA|nr:tripartite tricarboxylate transporter substrate binding protein [Lutispora sp.]MEA4962574.1 tripartite tricarboxylate transporter substrate binding protein [Lutispora sp.]HCJ58941.1 hypothetical protein [Clostridiaceae bacterium]